MYRTIIDLWNGNIAPCEHCGSHDLELNRVLCLIEHDRDALCEGMTETQKETFQKYTDHSEEYLLRILELAFCDGFCLGSKLIIEAML